MSNGTQLERLWKLQAQVNNLVLDGKRDPGEVANTLQKILEQKREKFALIVDLGIITVPDDYNHRTALAMCLKKNRKMFYGANEKITDANFTNPTRILKAGDQLRVRAYGHVKAGMTTTPGQRMVFLREKNSVFTGAQGVFLVFEQKRDQLPNGKWYASFDEPERLCVGADGSHWVPMVRVSYGVSYSFGLGCFEDVWHDNDAFFSFSDVSLET